MAKLSINLQGRAARGTDSTEHGGTRLSTWEDDDKLAGNLPKSKVKTLLKNQKNVQNQSAVMPHDYVDKMHISKSNWLSRHEQSTPR
jgi:hypothetical protein